MGSYCHYTPENAFAAFKSSTTEFSRLSNIRSQSCKLKNEFTSKQAVSKIALTGTSSSWFFCWHQLLLLFPPHCTLGKVNYSFVPGPEPLRIISTAHDWLSRNSHVKIAASHTGDHTSAKEELKSPPTPDTGKGKSRGALQRTRMG